MRPEKLQKKHSLARRVKALVRCGLYFAFFGLLFIIPLLAGDAEIVPGVKFQSWANFTLLGLILLVFIRSYWPVRYVTKRAIANVFKVDLDLTYPYRLMRASGWLTLVIYFLAGVGLGIAMFDQIKDDIPVPNAVLDQIRTITLFSMAIGASLFTIFSIRPLINIVSSRAEDKIRGTDRTNRPCYECGSAEPQDGAAFCGICRVRLEHTRIKPLGAVGDGSKKAAGAIGEGSKKAAGAIGEGSKKAAGAIGEGSKKAAGAIGEGSKKAAGAIGEGSKKAAGAIGDGSKKALGGLGRGARRALDGSRKALSNLGDKGEE